MIWFGVLLQQFETRNWWTRTRIDYHPGIKSEPTNQSVIVVTLKCATLSVIKYYQQKLLLQVNFENQRRFRPTVQFLTPVIYSFYPLILIVATIIYVLSVCNQIRVLAKPTLHQWNCHLLRLALRYQSSTIPEEISFVPSYGGDIIQKSNHSPLTSETRRAIRNYSP